MACYGTLYVTARYCASLRGAVNLPGSLRPGPNGRQMARLAGQAAANGGSVRPDSTAHDGSIARHMTAGYDMNVRITICCQDADW